MNYYDTVIRENKIFLNAYLKKYFYIEYQTKVFSIQSSHVKKESTAPDAFETHARSFRMEKEASA